MEHLDKVSLHVNGNILYFSTVIMICFSLVMYDTSAEITADSGSGAPR